MERFDEIRAINEARFEHEKDEEPPFPTVVLKKTIRVDWEEKAWGFIKRSFGRGTNT